MYIYDARNTKLSIIHGSHDRWPAGIYATRYVNWFVIASRCERIIQTISFLVAEIPRTESGDFRDLDCFLRSKFERRNSIFPIIMINMLKITDRVRLIYGVNVPRSNPNLDINYVSKDNSENL